MIKKIALLLICFILYYGTKATTLSYLDSIQSVLKKTTNTSEKLNCLYTLSFEYGLVDPIKGIKYGQECLELALRENDLSFQLNAYNGIANAYETLAKFDSAKYFHFKSYEVAKKMNAPQKMALTSVNIALCYKQNGDYKNALRQYLTAYKLFEPQSSYNPRIHFYLGEIYMRLGDYVNAEYYSRLGLRKCVEFKQDYIFYNLYINLGKCYHKKGELDSAVFVLSDALKGLERNTDKVSIGGCLNALGEVYISKKEYEKAHNNFSKELEIQKTLKNDNGICLAYLNMAHSLSKMNKINKGEIHNLLKQSEILLPTIKKNSDILLEIYYKLAETYERIDDLKNALTYYKLYFSLNNSLLNKDKVKQIFELQTRYDTEKKESQIKLLQQSDTIKTLEIRGQDEQIKARNITIVLIVSSLFFILFYFYNNFQRQQLKSKLEKEQVIKATEEKERMRMAKDIHDDLGSGLSKIRFLSEIVFRKSKNDQELFNASSGISETASHLVENMRDLIWELNPENTTLANLTARIREYSNDYLEEFGAEVSIKFPELIPNSSISKELNREIFMVVKECLNNIVKHSRASRVNILLAINSCEFQLAIIDNGVGISANRSKDGNGLKNIKNRIESVGGKIVINSSECNGTLIQFSVPFE